MIFFIHSRVNSAPHLYRPCAGDITHGKDLALICAGSQVLFLRRKEPTRGRKCVHTLVVEASVRAATGGSKDCVTGAHASYVGNGVEEKKEMLDEAHTDDTSVRSLKSRTAEHMIDRNPGDYKKRLRNAPHLMSINNFHPELRGTLPALPRCEPTGDVLEFTTSQPNCSSCGDPSSSYDRNVEGKLMTRKNRTSASRSRTEDIYFLAITYDTKSC